MRCDTRVSGNSCAADSKSLVTRYNKNVSKTGSLQWSGPMLWFDGAIKGMAAVGKKKLEWEG